MISNARLQALNTAHERSGSHQACASGCVTHWQISLFLLLLQTLHPETIPSPACLHYFIYFIFCLISHEPAGRERERILASRGPWANFSWWLTFSCKQHLFTLPGSLMHTGTVFLIFINVLTPCMHGVRSTCIWMVTFCIIIFGLCTPPQCWLSDLIQSLTEKWHQLFPCRV